MPFVPLEVFANNPSTTVSSGGTGAPSQGTVETWTVASSATFPATELGATQFHVADPALPGEMITVTNVSGTTWTVIRGAEASTTVAHTAGFTVVQVITAGVLANLEYPPWQFPVKAYGANGDGKIGTGGTGTSGTSTFTDAAATFVNAAAPLGDVGKYIIINQGTSGSGTTNGTVQNPFVGTITAVGSATSVTLSGNLAAPCAAAPYIYGTDDVSAINAAVAAAAAWATTTGNYRAQVMFEPGNYMLGTGPTQTTSPNQYNAQIPIPIVSQFSRKLVIDLVGVGGTAEPFYAFSTVPSLQGTCLVSAQFVTGQPNGTFGSQSVVGGPSGTTGLGTGNQANTLININGIMVVCPWNSQQVGFDFQWMAQANFIDGSYVAFAPVNLGGQTIGGPYLANTNIVSNGQSMGVRFPVSFNNDFCASGLLVVMGANVGIQVSEHFNASKLTLLWCNIGLSVSSTLTPAHGITIEQLSCENCNIIIDSTVGSGGPCAVMIGLMDSEVIGTSHINDPSNFLSGIIGWSDLTATHPVVSGGTGLVVYNMLRNLPGPWGGAPSAPTSTTKQQNTSYRPATVYVSAATSITNTSVGLSATSQTALGQAAGAGVVIPVRVPAGHWYSVTYTGALTTTWVLE